MSQVITMDGNGVLVMPRGEILQAGPVVAVRLLPVCRSPKCADVDLSESNPTVSIFAVLRAELGLAWTFEWHPIQHGIAACSNCGAWHRIYFYDETKERGSQGWRVYREPELIDDRPEHNPPTPSFEEKYREYMDEGHRRAVVRAVPQREEVKHG